MLKYKQGERKKKVLLNNASEKNPIVLVSMTHYIELQ